MSHPIPPDAYVLIIGAMKSGTTSLYSYLEGHPELCAAAVKEPEFFSQRQGHQRVVAQYEDLWSFDPSVHRYAMEASTGYTKYPRERGVPERIKAYGLRPRFVYIIRDPFARIESQYNMMAKNPNWPLHITDTLLLCMSNYYFQLEQYTRFFSADDILLLDFDTLKETPAQALQAVYDFLGLSATYFPEAYAVKNETKVKNTYEKKLDGLRRGGIFNVLPKPVRQAGKRWLQKAAPGKRRLTDTERAYIHWVLRDDMRQLHQTFGVDVEKWGFEV